MPDLYILMGANGAGKSTTGAGYLPPHIRQRYEIFDGDKLYWTKIRELYKHVTPSIKEAQRLSLDWLFIHFEKSVKTTIEKMDDFVYEGHLPEDENWKTPKRFKRKGYTIHIIYLGIKDVNLSALRVFERAKLGGHNVPPYEIDRNFYGNLRQINKRFKWIDELKIMDTTDIIPRALALLRNGIIYDAVNHGKLPEWFELGLPGLYKKIEIKDASEFTKKISR